MCLPIDPALSLHRHWVVGLMIGLIAARGPLPSSFAKPPNIVLILADDLGFGDLHCYGSEFNDTPHIDRLAAGGVRFTDFHAAGPMCSPTRAAMLTGMYQQRFGREFDSALSGTQHRELGLPHKAVTIAEKLQAQGYATACFGKWHLGYQPPWLPNSQGFDLFRGLASGDGDFHSHIDRSGNPDWWHNDRLKPAKGYTTELLTQYSLEFIASHRDEPFFLYIPHLAIHFPWQGPHDPPHRRAGTSYHNDKWGIIPNMRNVKPHVRAMIRALDSSVGQVLAAIREHGLEENTLVIFTSDNGGYLNYGRDFANISSNGQLRGQKTQLYEGGHRVPAIFSWPGVFSPTTTDATAHSIDLFPTLLALADADGDANSDGIDLSDHLTNGRSLPQRRLYWRADEELSVRDGPWKLYANQKATELYNLNNDLRERHNLAEEHPQLTKLLLTAWKQWEGDVNQSATQLLD